MIYSAIMAHNMVLFASLYFFSALLLCISLPSLFDQLFARSIKRLGTNVLD